MISIVLAHMRDRPMPVVLNALLIAFAGALLLTLAALSSHVTTRFERDIAGVDLVVSAKGSPLQVILSSLFHVDVPTGNIPLEAARRLGKNPLVAKAIPLAVGDRFRGYRVVGTTADYPALYGADVASGTLMMENESAVVGATAARALGITVGQRFAITHGLSGAGSSAHEDYPLTVSAILKPTGSVIDRLILTSLEAVWEAHGIHIEEDGHAHENEKGHEGRPPEITALLVQYASPLAAVRLPQQINQQTQLMAAVPAYETARLLSVFGLSRTAVRTLAAAFAVLGAFAIFTSLWSALEGRQGDIALYRLLGAQPRHVFSLLILEGLITAVLGAVGAWLIARLFLWHLSHTITALLQSGFSPLSTSALEISVLIAIICIGPLAAVPAALKAARMPLARALV